HSLDGGADLLPPDLELFVLRSHTAHLRPLAGGSDRYSAGVCGCKCPAARLASSTRRLRFSFWRMLLTYALMVCGLSANSSPIWRFVLPSTISGRRRFSWSVSSSNGSGL